MSKDVRVGFLGKVPSHGDFIARNLSRDMETEILTWAQAGLEYSKTVLRQSFLEKFLVAPVWRGYLSSTLFGNSYVFVWIPSVDKVGRYFPFLILCKVSKQLDPFETSCEKWFSLAEDLALSVLDEKFRIDPFLEQVRDLGYPLCEKKTLRSPNVEHSCSITEAQNMPIEVQSDCGTYTLQANLNRLLLGRLYDGYCQLWTQGGDHKTPTMLINSELPRGAQFVKLIADCE